MVLALGGLAASAVALASAPLLMPDDYSWVANTTSESAAQGVSGAWLARLGLLLFGLTVLFITRLTIGDWPRVSTLLHRCFGVLLTASATFSTRPWRPGVAFDGTEDALHSVAASAMGFAFAFGVAGILLVPPRRSDPLRVGIGIVALVATVALPMAMWLWPGAQGLLQRAMFLVAYIYYASETLRTRIRSAPA